MRRRNRIDEDLTRVMLRGLTILCVVVGFLLPCGCTDGESEKSSAQQSTCNLIGDQKCGTNSVGKAVVMECQVVESPAGSSVVKEWHIAQACEHCCIEAMCATPQQCARADVSSDGSDDQLGDVEEPKPDVLRNDSGVGEDSLTEDGRGYFEVVEDVTSVSDTTASTDIWAEEDIWAGEDVALIADASSDQGSSGPDVWDEGDVWDEDVASGDFNSGDSASPTCPEDKCHPSNPCGWDCNQFCNCENAAWDHNDCHKPDMIDCHKAECCQPGDPCEWAEDQQCECGGKFAWDAVDCGG